MAWTEDQKQQLRDLWETKLSARQIAAAIGGGLTRNAVIGQSNRMGLPMRRIKAGKPVNPEGPPPKRKRVRIYHRPPPIVPAVAPEPQGPPGGVFISELVSTSCRAIIGSERPPNGLGEEPKYCGGPAMEDQSWCSHHAALYLQPPRKRS